ASRAARWDGILERPPIIVCNFVRRDLPEPSGHGLDWDLLYAGTVSEGRRPDLLIELARLRPDLRIGIAGRGRGVDDVARAADTLPNLTYLGWRTDVDTLFARTRAIYYGLDPAHPYSEVACPNTLYPALRRSPSSSGCPAPFTGDRPYVSARAAALPSRLSDGLARGGRACTCTPREPPRFGTG